jgi:hypothetical protein
LTPHTPIEVLPSNDCSGPDDEDVGAFNGARLVFQNTNAGYKIIKEGGDAARKKERTMIPRKRRKKKSTEVSKSWLKSCLLVKFGYELEDVITARIP